MVILAIDPGNIESAFVVLNKGLKPIEFGKVDNYRLLEELHMDRFQKIEYVEHFVIEAVASYGMAVGKEVFDTCIWIGRFWERANFENKQYIYRKDEKMNLCHSMKANDSNIRQALIDRFGVVGTKANKGWFYGVSKDVWAAIAVGVTYSDMYLVKTEG